MPRHPLGQCRVLYLHLTVLSVLYHTTLINAIRVPILDQMVTQDRVYEVPDIPFHPPRPRHLSVGPDARQPTEAILTSVLQAGQQWKLTWSDEFDGDQIDPQKWSVYNNRTHGPTELELYMSYGAYVHNGSLVLETKPNKVMYGSKQYNFTSGWVESQNHFYQKFGRFEVNAKLPDSRAVGNWPAHWLMPQPTTSIPPHVCWPVGGEIDIMEAVGSDFTGIVGTYHWAKECGKDLYGGGNGKYPGPHKPVIDFSADYHLFAVEWNATSIVWSVDNNPYHSRIANATLPIPQDPFYVILNTAIAGYYAPKNTSYYPCYHYIDYVRVYEAVPSESKPSSYTK